MTRYGTFFNAKRFLTDSKITFYERKRMKQFALFLTDVKKCFFLNSNL
jgi:hypothetical protein